VPGTGPEAPAAATAPTTGRVKGGVAPLMGKLIGTPFQGTHAKAFNVQGGSDNWESENAVDIAAKVGSPIYAVANGRIGSQFGSLGEGGRFAGLRLHLQTGGNDFYYAHLSKFAPGIKPGTVVRKGQVIGYSGEANGVAHLHFSAQHGDPRSYAAVKRTRVYAARVATAWSFLRTLQGLPREHAFCRTFLSRSARGQHQSGRCGSKIRSVQGRGLKAPEAVEGRRE
jgi:murein DD-endopeptidase MepM/ murein hydrolase activator NlpD